MQTAFRKTVCSVMAFMVGFMTSATNYAVAQAVAQSTAESAANIGKAANAYGKDLGKKALENKPTFDNLNIKFKAGDEDFSISKDSLAPKDNGKNIRYSYTSDDFEKQKDLYNNSEAMEEKGTEQKDNLFASSESESPTLEGEVYSVLVDMAKKNHADYSQDIIFEKTAEIMADMENVLKDLVTCDAKSALDTQNKYTYLADLKECQQVVDRSTTCTINHDYSAGIVEHADGPFNIKSCGEGCTELWIGKIGDNYWCGTCQIHEEWTQVRVHNPDAIVSATLDYVKWDDYMMVYVGKAGSEQLVWTGPYDWRLYPNYFPPETPGKCELSTSWSATPSGPVANCNAPARCPYGGMLKGGTSTECDCNPRPDCNEICDFGGVPKKDGTQSCSCRAKPDCNEQCVYGGTPLRDGTQACRCLPNPNPKPGENPWTNITLPWTEDPLVEPPDPVESDEEAPDSEQTPGVDVTQFFKGAQDGDLINFKTRVSVSGCGEGYGRIRIRYDPEKIVSNDLWKPKDCVDAATGIDDGFAEGEMTCTQMPELDSNGCAWVNGAQVCERHLNEPPMGSGKVSRFCRKVEVKTNYNFYKGDTGCWKALVGFDANGKAIYEEVCGGENIGGNLDTCTKYKDDPNCKFVSSQCTPGMTGESGTCYVNDVVYDCGKDVKIDQVQADTTYDCKGITCLGEECIDAERTYSTDFAKINALLNAAQYMAEDMTCSGLDDDGNPIGDQNVECTVFGGTSGFCKIAVGGWQDCCEPVGGPGVGEYIAMIQRAQMAHSATVFVGEAYWNLAVDITGETLVGGSAAGQYVQMFGKVKDVLASGIEYLGKAFSSGFDNVYGFIDYIAEPFKLVKDWVMEKLKEYIKELLVKILNECGYGGVTAGTGAGTGTQTAAGMADGVMANAMAAVAIVAWIYLAYQVANLVIQLVYKCEDSEYETVSKREAKNCHYVGSYCKSKKLGICIVKHRVYCCYESPLSRIINEQIKATQPEILGNKGSWGDPENPICDGVPLTAIDKIDWDLINLDEWTALLVSTGNMKTADGIDIDKLTGAQSMLNWTGSKGTVSTAGLSSRNDSVTEFTKDQTPQVASTMSMRSMMRSKASTKSSTDRRNVIQRSEEKLNGSDVDGLRTESAKCITLTLASGITVRGGCGEETNAELVCRHNGPLYDCEEIAYRNSLGELLNNKPTNQEYWDEGYRCIKNELFIDCSTLYSKDAYIRALEEYARIIGGTTYLNRYVCLDKSGKFNQLICEHAMEQNYCGCLPGEFVCQDGNKVISCMALGATKNKCECLYGACADTCKYGGTPKGQQDNAYLVCTDGNCPYGHVEDGVNNCNARNCPYGTK